MLSVPVMLEDVVLQRIHRFSHLWRIEPEIGEPLHFTSHNHPILFQGVPYVPGGGWDPTAQRRESGLRELDKEFRGVIDSDAITAEDLRARRYDRARVTEFLVDWRYPWAGKFQQIEYLILEVEFTGEIWEATVGGLTSLLMIEQGLLCERHCAVVNFGDDLCGIDLDGTHPGTGEPYISVPEELYELVEPNLLDVVGNIENWSDGDASEGWLEWVTGKNAGIRQRIHRHYVGTHPTIGGTVLELYDPPPFETLGDKDVGAGESPDTFYAVMGCDRTWVKCGEYENRPNYRGFPYLPGIDKMLENPAAN